MDDGPIRRLAERRILAASADIEAQLSVKTGCRPVLFVLLKAREEAAEAMVELATLDTTATRARITHLQNEVRRYDDIVRWLREIVQTGFELDRDISEAEREELADLLAGTPNGEREMEDLGLIERDLTDAS